jgi:hypothetical protein
MTVGLPLTDAADVANGQWKEQLGSRVNVGASVAGMALRLVEHEHLIQSSWLLQGTIGVERLPQPNYEELKLLLLCNVGVPARPGHEFCAIIIDEAIAAK